MNSLQQFFGELGSSMLHIPSIRITDVIDIFLVAIVIYIVMCWIKETRAWSLFRGLVVIIFVSLIAYNLHFYTITWLIEKTFSVGVIAFIILFQPEIRKALEQIGEGGFSSIFHIFKIENKTTFSSKEVDEITTAVFKMAKVKTGALILVENNVPVGDIIRTGIDIDAIISSQLLINIFEDKTPLHDGAVIIRGNRIAAATCIMPVTQNQIGADLGTRHRAAVGATEVSDSYVIVVSEETGKVSLAREGKLKRNLSEHELKNTLMQLVDKTSGSHNKLWRGRQDDEKID